MRRTTRNALAVALTSVLLLSPPLAPAQAVVDLYANYALLAAATQAGTDFRIELVYRDTNLIIVAPHGGGIEAGTSELARAISGQEVSGEDWSVYRFEGIRSSNNGELHITSTNFDEPRCMWALSNSTRAVALHGYSDTAMVVQVGGLDTFVRDRVISAINNAVFSPDNVTAVVATGGLAATEPANIVNEGLSKAGVQLEISSAVRNRFFTTNTLAGRWGSRTADFHVFVAAVRSAIDIDSVAVDEPSEE
jgi:phage replication-related protein YjqB (UPF0714/DUF867 family)